LSLPLLTTTSSMTKAGVPITPYAIISAISVTFSIVASIHHCSKAVFTLDSSCWHFAQPVQRILISIGINWRNISTTFLEVIYWLAFFCSLVVLIKIIFIYGFYRYPFILTKWSRGLPFFWYTSNFRRIVLENNSKSA
jgi:hypothetical protein